MKDLIEKFNGSELEESAYVNDILKDILGRDVLKKIRKLAKDDQQTQDLSREVFYELKARLDKVMDDRFVGAMNRLVMASKQPTADSARNLVFKAANELGLKLPSVMF
jgi:hypothetical protein